MPTPKYNFTAINGQLVVDLDNSSLQWDNNDTSSYRASSINIFNSRKIYLYDFGEYEREFEFENIGTIDGNVPSTIENAYDLLSALIPSGSGGGSGSEDKIYTALISQSGTDDPTVTVLDNTIGNIVWVRSTSGFYFGNLNGAFPDGKTYLSITPSSSTASYSIFRNTDNQIVIRTQDNGTMPFTDADSKLFSNSIEIKVYN